MYNFIGWCLEIGLALFRGYCLQYFYGSFLEQRWKKMRHMGFIVAVLYGAARYLLSFFWPMDYSSLWVFANQALSLSVMAVFAVCFYKAMQRVTVFLVVTFMAISEISAFFAYTAGLLGNGILDLLNFMAEKGFITSHHAFAVYTQVCVIGMLAFLYLVFAVVMYFSLKGVVRNFDEKDYAIQRTELFFLIAPGMVGLLLCMLLRIILFTVEDEVPKSIYDRYPMMIFVVPAILFLSLFSIISCVRSFQDMVALNRERSGRMVLEKQVESLKEHMGEMERVYSGIRSMKHDMRNTISVITQLAAGTVNEELAGYLWELNQAFDKLDFLFKTGNNVVDALLNMKYHEYIGIIPDLVMNAEGLLLPGNLFIQSYDLGIILGNALDNALEACRKLKCKEPDANAFINISSFWKGNLLILKVENSFDGRLVKKPQTEFPTTDKADKQAHGIGLANIKSAVKKYQGAVDWKITGRVFTLSVILKNEEMGS